MIDRQKELQENLELLSTPVSMKFGEEVPEQSRILDSNRMNTAFRNMEIVLNSLYEKARALEDATSYTKSFLLEEIVSRRKKIENRIEEIEKSRDALKEESFRAEIVHLHKRAEKTLRDRDGSSIPPCGLKDKKLTLSGQVLEEIEVKSHSRSLSFQSEGKHFQGGKTSSYMTKYRTEEKPENGIREKVSFLFGEARELSSIDAEAMNCAIAEVAFINENDAEQLVPQSAYYQFYPVRAKGVSMTLVSKNPERIDMDKKPLKSNPWDNQSAEDAIAYYEKDASYMHSLGLSRDKIETMANLKKSIEEEALLQEKYRENGALKADMERG